MVNAPKNITSGETLRLCARAKSFSTLKFFVRSADGVVAQNIDSSRVSDGWVADFDTDGWAAGLYNFEARAVRLDGCKVSVGRGTFEVFPSLDGAAEGAQIDYRTYAEKTLEAIEAMVRGNASEGVKSYRINNRSLEYHSPAELQRMLDYWRRRVKSERRKALGLSLPGPDLAVYM